MACAELYKVGGITAGDVGNDGSSVWKSGLVTGKKPGLDQTKTD